ncbi:2OG-Fe(II) oxygenase [Alteromonas ponticola]|uniref:2OG-Fe(II) oxygenase n=1 Tax=Alteromonas aquimaris TaxID=2998417 RepID=A0ABT3P3W5_9ALTE|nr:2OG-Fe(II) oxygenase family protein [Alteromonas aquimaris]MCW8107466.1 2OG-Fe(II) oxygenase [Alteromonas aquimaris]
MQIKFNENFDLDAAAVEFQHDKRGRFTDVLDTSNASEIYTGLKSLSYDLALIHEQRYMSIQPSDWTSMDPQTKQKYITMSHRYASHGEGFIYGRKNLSAGGCGVGSIDAFNKWLNSKAVIAWIKKVSGHDDIVAASAQATRYGPGQFLTRHKDEHQTEQRRVAYVFNFTEKWHPDWGGLLQFYENDGTPRDSWTPGFNTLSLFDVKHIHSVTYVTPFALQPRLSITGWFRATPL